MSRFIGESDSIPRARDLKVRIPTMDELMRRPQPRPWWEFLPPPAQPSDNPFSPVPIIPAPPAAPIEVDPPSRPPEWLFGPPHISSTPRLERAGGILGMMVEAGLIDPSNPDRPPPGGLLGLIQEYMRNGKMA